MAKATKPKLHRPAFKEIYDRINCDSGIIFVDTPEETRLIREIFREFKDDSVQFWSIGQGLHEIEPRKIIADRFYPHKFDSKAARLGQSGGFDTRVSPLHLFSLIEEDCRSKIKPDEDPDKKHIYILRDLDKFLKDPVCLRRLKDLIYLCATACSCIVVVGYGITVPTDLEKDAVFIKLKYPSKEEIMESIIKDLRLQITDRNKVCAAADRIDDSFDDESVARACAGLTEDQILNTLQYTMTVDNKICIDKILEEKKAIINKSDILEYWICNDSLDDIGGFGEIKHWFNIKKAIIKNPECAAKFKAEQPKGMMLLGVQGSGKCQSLWTKVLMRDKTWKKMGDIQVGDEVLTPSGKPTVVTQIFEHPSKQRIELEFKDGRKSYCGPEHLWKIYNKNFKTNSNINGWKIVDTVELMKLMQQKDDTRRFYIPLMTDSEEGENLPIDPYTLGVLIGDGCLTKTVPSFTTADIEIVEKIKNNLVEGYKISEHISENKCPSYSIVKNSGRIEENYYRKQLSILGLQGLDSLDKFIPDVCYRLSLSDKKELIRGLMDSDGSTDDNLSYSTTSPSLAIGVQKLIRSIGGQAHISYRDTKYTYKGEQLQGQSSFRVNIRYTNPRDLVHLERKKSKLSENYQYSDLKLEILNVEYTGIEEDMRCIMLDDEEHLYITDDYVVTHNTAIAKALAQSWGVGLIKLDIGKVFAGLVGESEKRMRQALTQMDAAGGIVVIDEIDKSLSGAGSSDKTDGGTTNRVISTLLTWLSEDHPGVFLIATANDISNLLNNHPELFRKGRFDEIWFSDIPNVEERKEIFKIHLRKRGRDVTKFNIDALAEYEFADEDGSKYAPTGAEIESSIKDAIQTKLAAGIQKNKEPTIGAEDDITTDDIMATLRKIKPITKIAKSKIGAMRRWSADNAANVSVGIKAPEKKKASGKKVNLRADSEEIEL